MRPAVTLAALAVATEILALIVVSWVLAIVGLGLAVGAVLMINEEER